ncbi:MAG: hypothetical protein H8D67_17465 [Deltaproteobacteria bacterium]|nr:hypothetical protein [Deltaproteobacteria bacterium]
MEKPNFVRNEHLEYLDGLRNSGITNMFGAVPYLKAVFPTLSNFRAKRVLTYWMETFDERPSDS